MIDVLYPERVALLIDAENISLKSNTFLKCIKEILELSDYFGELVVSEAYGDWNIPKISSHKGKLEELKIECIQVDNVGKNAADGRILMRAGELLSSDTSSIYPAVLIMVSGDGDFASACAEIHKRIRKLIVIGGKNATHQDLTDLCDKFYYLQNLQDELRDLDKQYPTHPRTLRAIFYDLRFTYWDLVRDFAWVNYEQLENALIKKNPELYGNHNLAEYLKHFESVFEQKGEMIRRIDPDPMFTRSSFLHTAFKRARQKKGDRIPLSFFRQTLYELAHEYAPDIFETYFGGKKISEWIDMYPKYLIEQGCITIAPIDTQIP